MFPPSSNGLSPFFQPSFTDSTSQNPSSSTAHHSSAFLHFLPAFLDENYDFVENEYFLSQQQQQQEVLGTNLGVDNSHEAQEIKPVDSETANKATRSIKNKKKRCSPTNVEKQQNPQRRTRKKDRHSKIYTAQGPRDRRMRLSLQIARKFFDLQDMLGFDKASKTIDWLFNKSKAAIKDLSDSIPKRAKQCSSSGGGAGGGKSVSSTSESEVVSGIKRHPKIESFVNSPMVKKSKKNQKSPVYNPLARESREKARARARERTRERLKNKNTNNAEQLVASSPLENLDCGSQEVNCPVKGINGEDQEEQEPTAHLLQRGMDSLDLIDRFMGIGNGQNFGVSSGANFEDEYSGFPATWEMNNGRVQYLCCEMPNIKSSSTGNVHEQNPNAIFLTNPPNDHHQEQNFASSIFETSLNYQQGNPNPVLMNISKGNTTHQQNPSSILMTTATNTDFHSHHFIGDRFFFTTTTDVVDKYDNLY